MPNKILLNDEEYIIDKKDLPLLVNYKEKSGGTLLSLTIIANLFLQGYKILFFTAYSMAKNDFLKQLGEEKSEVSFISDKNKLSDNAQGIIIESGNEELFLQAIDKINDIDERIIFVKNIEIFGEKIIDFCLNKNKIILSGDIDKCADAKRIFNKKFKTLIFFNEAEKVSLKLPILEKYAGYLKTNSKKGFIKLKIN